MTYKATHEGYVIRDGDTKIAITDSPEYPNTNADYLAYKDWLAAGNTPEPADPLPVVVPQVISRAQGEYILIEMDLMDSVKAFIAAIPSKKKREQAEVAVFATQEWRFDSPTLNSMMAQLGITEQQKIEMFIAADKVEF